MTYKTENMTSDNLLKKYADNWNQMLKSGKTTPKILQKVQRHLEPKVYKKRYSSVREIIEADLPSVILLRQHYSTKEAVSVASITIAGSLMTYFDIEMKKETATELAQELLNDPIGHRLSIADLKFAIKQGAKKDEAYNRIDFSRVWKWLESHAEEKAKEFARMKEVEHQRKKNSKLSPEIAKKIQLQSDHKRHEQEQKWKREAWEKRVSEHYEKLPDDKKPETLEEYILQRKKKVVSWG